MTRGCKSHPTKSKAVGYGSRILRVEIYVSNIPQGFKRIVLLRHLTDLLGGSTTNQLSYGRHIRNNPMPRAVVTQLSGVNVANPPKP